MDFERVTKPKSNVIYCLLLMLGYIIYLLFGAYIFSMLESPYEVFYSNIILKNISSSISLISPLINLHVNFALLSAAANQSRVHVEIFIFLAADWLPRKEKQD